MKTKASAADAKTAQVTNLNEVQKGKKFAEVQKAAKEVVDVTPIEEETISLPQQTQEQTEEKKPVFSMQDYKDRIEKMHQLTLKHNSLSDRLKDAELFEIKKETQSANVRLADNNGVSFYSNDPQSIDKILRVIKECYNEQKSEVEKQIFDLLSA